MVLLSFGPMVCPPTRRSQRPWRSRTSLVNMARQNSSRAYMCLLCGSVGKTCEPRVFLKVLPRIAWTLAIFAPSLSRRGFSCCFHHCLFHAVFARTIQAHFVTVGIIQISVPPAPRHHAGQLGHVEALLLKLATEVVEIVNLEVEADTITRNGSARTGLMQGDGSIAARCTHARVHRHSFIAELFDQLESKHIAVEVESAIPVFHVDHGVVEGKFSVRI